MALTLGLRFNRDSLPRLQQITDDLIANGRFGDASLFDRAADSTLADEPLIVHCEDRQEVERMAHGFTAWGVERPAIDELNG